MITRRDTIAVLLGMAAGLPRNVAQAMPAEQAPGGPKFGAIVQHGYVVHDVDQIAHQWTERMGVGPFYVADQPIDNYIYRGKPVDLKLRIGVSYWRGMQLELIQPVSRGTSFYSRALKRAPDKLNHYATLVQDIGTVVRNQNLDKFVVHTGGTPGLKFAYLENYLPDGTTLELMQVQESVLPAFAAMEAICRTWDGARPLRTMAELATDIGALKKPATQ